VGLRSQDNALVEGKNGAVIRKLIGYVPIPKTVGAALSSGEHIKTRVGQLARRFLPGHGTELL